MKTLRDEIQRLAPMLSDARLDDIMDAIASSLECCYDEHEKGARCPLPVPRPRPGPTTQCPFVRSFKGSEEHGYLYCLAGAGHAGEHRYDSKGIKGDLGTLGEWEPIEEARRKTAAAGGRWPT